MGLVTQHYGGRIYVNLDAIIKSRLNLITDIPQILNFLQMIDR